MMAREEKEKEKEEEEKKRKVGERGSNPSEMRGGRENGSESGEQYQLCHPSFDFSPPLHTEKENESRNFSRHTQRRERREKEKTEGQIKAEERKRKKEEEVEVDESLEFVLTSRTRVGIYFSSSFFSIFSCPRKFGTK